MAAPARVLVSACLLGEAVRWDGGHRRLDAALLRQWQAEGRVVGFCPECAAGLPVPRPPAEIEPGADAAAVLAGRARVLTQDGADQSAAFVAGAEAAWQAARDAGAVAALLKDASPSCGSRCVHDGRFAGATVPGRGVAAQRLAAAGLVVFAETEIEAAQRWLQAQDADSAAPDS
ncbi:purine-nucleoside phosphorylase [Rubrivivax gelatinosus]|nr:purine-nucleoside phosphorylase [Rubrivivax gelatinosus]